MTVAPTIHAAKYMPWGDRVTPADEAATVATEDDLTHWLTLLHSPYQPMQREWARRARLAQEQLAKWEYAVHG